MNSLCTKEKGSSRTINNYGITVLSVAGKFCAKIIIVKFTDETAEKVWNIHQDSGREEEICIFLKLLVSDETC